MCVIICRAFPQQLLQRHRWITRSELNAPGSFRCFLQNVSSCSCVVRKGPILLKRRLKASYKQGPPTVHVPVTGSGWQCCLTRLMGWFTVWVTAKCHRNTSMPSGKRGAYWKNKTGRKCSWGNKKKNQFRRKSPPNSQEWVFSLVLYHLKWHISFYRTL